MPAKPLLHRKVPAMLSQTDQPQQPPSGTPAGGASAASPAPEACGVTPLEATAAFDYKLSILVDHLLVIEDRFLQLEDALLATAAEFSAVKSLVEELLP
jgi:hypothetical protein